MNITSIVYTAYMHITYNCYHIYALIQQIGLLLQSSYIYIKQS